MSLSEIKPMLYTRHVRETVDFYTAILGFTCVNHTDDWDWAVLSQGDIEIMITVPNAHIHFEKPIFTGSFYIITDDVDALWDKINDKVKVCYELETFDYGMREFAVYDNNGYLLQFGQAIDN